MDATPVPPPPSPESRGPGPAWWRWVQLHTAAALRPFWVVPALWSVGAVLLAVAVPRLDAAWVPTTVPLFPGDLDGARSVLSTIAGAMISVTGLVFSITMVVLQLASSQYSPRVLQTFLEDRTTQHTLGVFSASFVYALTVLRSLGGREGIPELAVTLSYALVLGAVGMFLAFIHHITRSVGVASILQRTAQQARGLLAAGQQSPWPAGAGAPGHEVALPTGGRTAVAAAPRSGYLDALHLDRLAATARRHDVVVEVLHPLGDFVVEGEPLLAVRPADDAGGALVPDDAAQALVAGVELATDRSMRQDVTYGIRRLVDIAERALSPGVNDPTTAVQVLDQLHDLLHRMLVQDPRLPVWSDADGRARVVLRQPDVEAVLHLALAEVVRSAADDPRVLHRVEQLLVQLASSARPAYRDQLKSSSAVRDRFSSKK